MDFENFTYVIKRFTYKGSPLQEQMIKEMCPDIGIDYNDIKEDVKDKETATYLTMKNKFLFNQGNYNLMRLLLLGFLYCHHPNKQTRCDEWWQLLNPEIEEEIPAERIIENLKALIYIAVYTPLLIENGKH